MVRAENTEALPNRSPGRDEGMTAKQRHQMRQPTGPADPGWNQGTTGKTSANLAQQPHEQSRALCAQPNGTP